jgi:hypothetical protein
LSMYEEGKAGARADALNQPVHGDAKSRTTLAGLVGKLSVPISA